MNRKQKKEDKERRKIKNTFDWMNIENVDQNGIYLKDGKDKRIVKGLRLTPLNLYLFVESERVARIYRLSHTFDKLYNLKLYFKFIKTEPDITLQTVQFMNSLEEEQNPAISQIINMQVNKLDWFRTYNREVKFYVMIQDDMLHIDKSFQLLIKEFAEAWGSYDLIQEMTYQDYKNVIEQEFENDRIDEYLFTQAVLPQVDPLELEKMNKDIKGVEKNV